MVVQEYLAAATRLLGLKWLLHRTVGEEAATAVATQEPAQPASVCSVISTSIRCTLLVLLGFAFHAVLSSWLLHLPLLLGRALMPTAYYEGENDCANYILGAVVIFAVYRVAAYLRQQIATYTFPASSRREVVQHWIKQISQIFAIFVWFLAAVVLLTTRLTDLLVNSLYEVNGGNNNHNTTREHQFDVVRTLPMTIFIAFQLW